MPTQSEDINSNYPLQIDMNGTECVLRSMTPEDGPALLKFAQSLPAHDILFMRRNIAEQAGVDKWVNDIRDGRVHSVVAIVNDEVVGYSTIHLTELDWTRHVAELRVSVSLSMREHGLGRTLIREAFKLAVTLGVEIVTSRMTPDQKGARALFEELGFRNEALLKDHMKDKEGEYHDLLVMAVNVDEFLARRQAYGLT